MRRAERFLAAGAALGFAAALVVGLSVPSGADDGTTVFAFTDPAIVESSGLAVVDGLVATVNDSGDNARVFTVDPDTGDTVGVTTYDGGAVDVEALAPAGGGEVWVGDIGDNLAQRDSVSVVKVPVGRGDRHVTGERYTLTYPDGPHDAETLLADPGTGRLFVVVKEFIGRVYAAPKHLDPDGPNRMTEVGDALGIGTDGAFLPDGRHVVVRNYGQAAFYTWPDLARVDTITLPTQEQGEGIAVTGPGSVYLSSEGANSDVLKVRLPTDLRAELASPQSRATDGSEAGSEAGSESGAAGTGNLEGDNPDTNPWPGLVVNPWVLGGAAILIGLVVLLRSLRSR